MCLFIRMPNRASNPSELGSGRVVNTVTVELWLLRLAVVLDVNQWGNSVSPPDRIEYASEVDRLP